MILGSGWDCLAKRQALAFVCTETTRLDRKKSSLNAKCYKNPKQEHVTARIANRSHKALRPRPQKQTPLTNTFLDQTFVPVPYLATRKRAIHCPQHAVNRLVLFHFACHLVCCVSAFIFPHTQRKCTKCPFAAKSNLNTPRELTSISPQP